ncbi:small ubiquitin-like modifier [Nannochloropsis oceanica]
MATVKTDEPKGESITLRVKDQTGEETMFKVKKTTKMEKVFNTYATRKGINSNALRFLLDGLRIEKHQTPEELDLEDEDQIDVMLEQLGGHRLRSQNHLAVQEKNEK